jgi:hypothetical protein
MHSGKVKILAAIGVVLLALVVFDIAVWIAVADDSRPFQENVAEYLSFHPSWLQSPRLITSVELVMLVVAGVCFSISGRKPMPQWWKNASKALLIMCALLAFWLLFTLM